VTDEAGNTHTTSIDGLGRLKSVDEPNDNLATYTCEALNK
jgi:YD repeat-containing protein